MGSQERISFITLNDSNLINNDNNRYGLIYMQSQINGTSCQGNCILTLTFIKTIKGQRSCTVGVCWQFDFYINVH